MVKVLGLTALSLSLLLLFSFFAHAQQVPEQAVVVAGCSTPGTYTAGQVRPMVVDTSGTSCANPDGVIDSPTATGSVTSATSIPFIGTGPFATVTGVPTLGYDTMSVVFTSVGTGVTITVEGSNDNTNWVGITYGNGGGSNTIWSGGTSTPTVTNILNIPLTTAFVRVRVNAYTSGTVTAIATLKRSTTAVTPNTQIVGNSASGSADSGNPVKVAGVFTSAPAAVATGQRVNAWADPFGNFGFSPLCGGCVFETASATGTTTAFTATLAAAAGKTTYICGFSIRAAATGATQGNATITGTITGTLNYLQGVNALTAGEPGKTEQTFVPCIPASAQNTTIVVNAIAAGAGGLGSITAWGFQQ